MYSNPERLRARPRALRNSSGTGASPRTANQALEKGASVTYNEGVVLCITDKDSASREIMEQIIRESEDSVDWLEAQLELIDRIGIQNYQQSQIGEE
jgi:bacterioferritin